MGSSNLLQLLINHRAFVNARYGIRTFAKQRDNLELFDVIPLPFNLGRTALHEATSNLHYDCVDILLENQADINTEDDEGQTPLLTTGENLRLDSINFQKQFETIIELLLKRGANINAIHSATGKGILHRAMEFGSIQIFHEIIQLGFDLMTIDNNGDTILHEACKLGNSEFVSEIIKHSDNIINARNKNYETAMHYAAISGSRPCLILLLNNGGDLSKTTSFGQSVVDAIFSSIPRPLNFILKIFDSRIIPNKCSINDRLFNITLDFNILTPDDEHQMSVFISFIKSLKSEQISKLMLHPLIESFIRLKWARLRIFFFFLVILHLIFVVSLSLYVVFLIDRISCSRAVLECSRWVLLSSSLILLLHVITEISLAPKYYLKEYETWLTLTCVGLSLTLGLWELFEMVPLTSIRFGIDNANTETYSDVTNPNIITTNNISTDYTNNLSGNISNRFSNEISNLSDKEPIWFRHISAFDVLLSWTLLMFILGRFPFVGYFALMFSTVLRNVLKVLLFFACLVIGFALSFCIQFNDVHFSDPWKAFVRTTVMLMGEFEYKDIFKEEQEFNQEYSLNRFATVSNTLFISSRVIFLLFILLGSIVLMNLMMGLAVNDIQGIRAEGCVRHIIKQAEFISHVEKILSKKKLRLLPRKIREVIIDRKILPSTIMIEPNVNYTIQDVKCSTKKYRNAISSKLMERIVVIAIKNQTEGDILNEENGVADNHDSVDIIKTLNDIKEELRILSSKLRDFL